MNGQNRNRQYMWRWMIAVILVSCSMAVAAPVTAKADDDAQEAFFTFRYDRIVKTTIIALFTRDSVYIPVSQIFSLTKVNHEIDNDKGTLTGVFSQRMIRYSINAKTLMAHFDGRSIPLDSGDILLRDLDWYVLPHVLDEIFGMEAKVEFNHLRITLFSQVKLPVLLDAERESAQRTALLHRQAGAMLGPLIAPPSHSLLDGGVLEYNLTAQGNDNLAAGEQSRHYTYGLVAGLRVLGGDVEIQTNGGYNGQTKAHTWRNIFAWRYVPDENEYLRQIHLGNLGSGGLLARSFDGVTVSNARLQRSEVFNVLQIDEHTEPLWEVELRQDGEIIDVTTADSSGRFHFSLPLRYGQTSYELWMYGPTGEQYVEQYDIQVPTNFIAPGEVNYAVSAGRDRYFGSLLAEGSLTAGVTNWLTAEAGADYVATPGNYDPVVYGTLNARLGYSHTMSINIAPSALYRASLGGIHSSGLTYSLGYTRHEDHPLLSLRGLRESIDMDIRPPTFGLPFTLFVRGSRDRYDNYIRYAARGGLNVSLLGIQTGITYNGIMQTANGIAGDIQHGATGNLGFRLWSLPSVLGLLFDNTTVRYSTFYDINDGRFTYAAASISRRLFSNATLGISVDKNLITNRLTCNASLNLQLSFARSSSNAQISDNTRSFTQNVRGTIALDSEAGDLFFTSRSMAGSGMAKLRFFTDYNGNGEYDAGEQVLKAGQIDLTQRGSTEKTADGEIRISQIPAYSRVGAELTENSVRNPLYVPRVKNFSFIAEPHGMTVVNVPFFVTGIVDGVVMRRHADTTEPIGGLKVHIDGVTDTTFHTTLLTFSDGSFNFLGLPPGEYVASVDRQHLKLLKARTVPEHLTFTVQPTQNGDFVQGINFELRDIDTEQENLPSMKR